MKLSWERTTVTFKKTFSDYAAHIMDDSLVNFYLPDVWTKTKTIDEILQMKFSG